jgi:hypothetical protein
MFERVINLTEHDKVFIKNSDKTVGCGYVNDDGHLYYINKEEGKAYQLPDKYKETPICVYPSVGGLRENMIMVSLLGEVDLQYHHKAYPAAGMWGWLNLDGEEIVSPQYIYAYGFENGKAMVCKGEWNINEDYEFWSDVENWGVVDTQNNVIIPLEYDEIFGIENTDRYFLCHKGGWDNGYQVIYDIEEKCEIAEKHHYYDSGYMFNECFLEGNYIVFDDQITNFETSYTSIYSIRDKKWIIEHEVVEEVEFLDETKLAIRKDGKEIMVY